MELKPDLKAQTAQAAQATAPVVSSVLPDGVPPISAAQVNAACKRSKVAREVRASFADAVDSGRVFSRFEVKDLLARAAPKGKPDGNAAVVVAYYADNHEQIFSKEAKKEIKAFLADVDWTTLLADLNNFIGELAEKEKAAEKEMALKKEILEEGYKVDDRKRALVKENGTVADRKQELVKQVAKKGATKERLKNASERDLDEELTSSGRVPLSEKESTELKLRKRAFATRES